MYSTAFDRPREFTPLPSLAEFAEIFTMDTSMETTVTTYSGKEVNLLAPALSSIDILDIAHHEAQINRYNGGCAFTYSVAQHSWLASHLYPDSHPLSLAILMHDGAETYVGDDVKQKKNIVQGTRELEDRLQRAICEKYGLPWPLPPQVKQADLAIYALELVTVLGWKHKVKCLPAAVRHLTIEPMDWEDARHLFLARFYKLYYGTRTVRFKTGELFGSGDAAEVFTALTKSFHIDDCCKAMETGLILKKRPARPLLTKAA